MEKKADVVVIGGSAGGLTAAITARRHYPGKNILLIRREERVLIPCGIPYVFGTVDGPEADLIPDALLEKNGIELLVDEVTGTERERHRLTTAGGHTVGYRKLVLATGSIPSMPPIPGREKDNVFVVEKNVPHLRAMLDQLEKSRDVVVVGGGFIGMEFADECRKSPGTKVSVVEMLPHCLMLSFDDDVCERAESIARDQGIQILAPEKVEAFEGNGAVRGVRLASGRTLEADMVIVGAGCRANTALAEQMGLELGPLGGVQVNRYMVTSDPDIFACGDCAAKVSFFDGKPSGLKLASTAAKEARIVGANLFGKRRANEGELGVWSTVVDETAFAGAGLSVSAAREKGYDVVVGQAESVNRHPGGMPGAAPLKVKLVFERATGVLIGGQVSGAKCGGELINIISACVHERMTADDLATFPMGTHPALTASPIAYQLTNAAEMAISAARGGGPVLREAAAGAAAAASGPAAARPDRKEDVVKKPPRILVVDDDPDFLESTRMILEAASYSVDVASSAAEALDRMAVERPDFLILDVMMSEWNSGFKLLWKLRSQTPYQDVPVLMVTGVDRQMGIDFAQHACSGRSDDDEYLPVDGYLEKPVSASELLGNVEWVLRKTRGQALCG
jgi:pyruvate/2-oxoglutarate dehydrogenase complex dihydrolipoamide dehydrogenase (E3) component/ActR/RegA family two-component response regulator